MKPNKHKSRLLTGLCAVIVCMAAFSVSASAAAYYASDESGKKVPPGTIDSITISTEDVELDNSGSNAATEIDGITVDLDSFFDNLFNIFGGTDALTPVGNLTLVDDILQDESTASVEKLENEQKSKQFITVQSKNGNYFYIIIDRSGDKENVYFLNLVDETDLFALLETEEETTPAVNPESTEETVPPAGHPESTEETVPPAVDPESTEETADPGETSGYPDVDPITEDGQSGIEEEEILPEDLAAEEPEEETENLEEN